MSMISLGFVLTVRVDLDHRVVVMAQRELEAGSHRGADPEIEWQDEHFGARRACSVHRSIDRPVVDHKDVSMRDRSLDLADGVRDAFLLVSRRRDDQEAQRRRPRHGRSA